MANWYNKLTQKKRNRSTEVSFLRTALAGSLFKISEVKAQTSLQDIKSQIDTMRALCKDSQIATTLSYYATDATTTNSSGKMIWATPTDPKYAEAAEIANTKLMQWQVSKYARDHILELATVGNLYLPTTDFNKKNLSTSGKVHVSLDGNTIKDDRYEVIASKKILPENIVHVWLGNDPKGFIYQPTNENATITYPEQSVIHFSLGGLLGDYTIECSNSAGEIDEYDIQFGTPLLINALQPTQTLNLLEDASVLSSLIRTVKFIAVECGNAEESEIQDTLIQIKTMIEQQMSINTATGDAQSFVNPQSPNNLIYVPKVNGADPISITDLNMAESNDADNKLLEYYQNKKLSVLGIPKEAMNFSSAEGLGGAGNVMSQRSALYANSLQRIESAYMEGWKDALNKYFVAHNASGFVDKFELHMNPIITQLSTVNAERRDAAISQASAVVDLLKSVGVDNADDYKAALVEMLADVFPVVGNSVSNWKLNVAEGGESDAF